MREMGWSWDQLEAAPVYVRRYCWDFTAALRRIAADRRSAADSDDDDRPGVTRVRR